MADGLHDEVEGKDTLIKTKLWVETVGGGPGGVGQGDSRVLPNLGSIGRAW